MPGYACLCTIPPTGPPMSRSDHFVGERQALIHSELLRHGRVSAQELAQKFAVSEDTVRRDLREMSARGECERVYGGALLISGTTVPLKTRMTLMTERKAAMGGAAAALLQDGMTVFLDAGSTNLAIAQHLSADARLTIITNTPDIAAQLTGRNGVELILIGGRVDPAVGAAIDTTAIKQLEDIRPDLCIVGVCGLSLIQGLYAQIYADAVFKRLACQASTRILCAITSEKIEAPTAFHVHPLTSKLTLVLEADADAATVETLRKTGVETVLASASSPVSPITQTPKDQSR